MEPLYLLRHAQAVAFAPGQTDHERSLTEHGRNQAVAVGDHLRASDARIDRVLCSTSARTRQTLAALDLEAEVIFSDGIYQAGHDQLLSELAALPGGSVLMIGHSPGIPSLARELAAPDSDPVELARIERGFPTATLVQFEVDQPWQRLDRARLVAARVG